MQPSAIGAGDDCCDRGRSRSSRALWRRAARQAAPGAHDGSPTGCDSRAHGVAVTAGGPEFGLPYDGRLLTDDRGLAASRLPDGRDGGSVAATLAAPVHRRSMPARVRMSTTLTPNAQAPPKASSTATAAPVQINDSGRRGPFSGLYSFDRLGAAPACVRARPLVGRRRSAVARSPSAHRFANPFPRPFRRNRAGMAAFAIRVGVALAVPRRGGRPAAATHSPVARLDRACLIAGWIVEIRLNGCFFASQPTSDLRDRQTLLVPVVAGELRRAAPFRDPVEHQNPKPTGGAGQPAERRTTSVREGRLLVMPRRAGDSGARDLLARPPVPSWALC